MDNVTQLIEALASLVGAAAWPAVFLFLLVRFRAPLGEFVSNMSEFSFRAPGLEATARQREIEAAAALGAATAKQATEAESESDLKEVAGVLVKALPTGREKRRFEGARLLWVDDRPDNNIYERQALEALGIRTDLSTSTEDALRRLGLRMYDVVISDMGRPPDTRAGYTLLDAMRARGDRTPFVIYAASRSPEHIRESIEHGAIGCTNRPDELISMVSRALSPAR